MVEYLKKRINNEGLKNNVILAGRIKHDDIPHWLSAADIFILPTYNEGMSNSLLEAMAVGLPCIASAVGGYQKLLKIDGMVFLYISKIPDP